MGRVVLEAAGASEDFTVVAGTDVTADGSIGNVPIFKTLAEVDAQADALIDFSRPAALQDILSYATERSLPVVLATTGYVLSDIGRMERAGKAIPVFRSANMSLGMNLLIDLAEKSAAFLGEGCDVEVIESHHRYKADAPSGTALMVADAINRVYQDNREYTYGRHSRNAPRAANEIGIHAIRGGTTIGEHTVQFLMDDEMVEIHHTSLSRNNYAYGALRAAQFVARREPGFYNMRDLLLEKSPVTRVRAERRVAMITLAGLPLEPGSYSAVFDKMAEHSVNLDMISQTPQRAREGGISFSLNEEQGPAAAHALAELFGEGAVHLQSHLVKVTIEGLGMERQSGIASRVFALMGKQGVLAHMVTTAPTEISLLVDAKDEFILTDALSKAFDI